MLLQVNKFCHFNYNNISEIISDRKNIVDTILNKVNEGLNNRSVKEFLYSYYYNNFRVEGSYADDVKVLTFVGLVPKIILAQINTHRTLSKNAASSRAIPFFKNIMNIIENPYLPFFTKNKKGMQGDLVDDKDEYLSYLEKHISLFFQILDFIKEDTDWHKQNINRYVEPFVLVPVVITGNVGIGGYAWDQFVYLRTSEAAQSEIGVVASFVQKCIQDNKIFVKRKVHAPIYVIDKKGDLESLFYDAIFYLKNDHLKPDHRIMEFISVFGSIARVSTMTSAKSIDEDYNLALRLYKERHMSPFEHVLLYKSKNKFFSNIKGYMSYRYVLENDKKV